MPDHKPYTHRSLELEAELYYLTTEEGGRINPVHTGYRGQLHYNSGDWTATQKLLDKEVCYPGETVKVYLETLSPDYHVGHLFVGQEIGIREGARTVAKGKITKVFRPDFNYWDGSTFLKSLDHSIKPYSQSSDIQGFKIDFDYALSQTNLFEDIQFKMTGNLECMIHVKCRLRHRNLHISEFADSLIECWKTELAFSNHLYKVQVPLPYDSTTNRLIYDKFILSFATWHSIFLTGQIIVG